MIAVLFATRYWAALIFYFIIYKFCRLAIIINTKFNLINIHLFTFWLLLLFCCAMMINIYNI